MLFVVVSVLLILTILIQRPQGGGLSGAFGSGAGSGQTAFGAKTGDALTIATIGMFALWVVFAVVLNFTVRPAEAIAAPAPAATAPADNGSAPADKGAPAPEKAPESKTPAGEKPAAAPDQPAVEKPATPPSTAPPPPPGDSPEKKDPGSPTLPPR
jgi:preprotein translocase subunit SecG